MNGWAKTFISFVFIAALLMSTELRAQPEIINRPDLNKIFKAQKRAGTFVMHDVLARQTFIVNPERARKPFIPASTFKVANSLIALETAVIEDENEIIPYGGKPQYLKIWEKDMSLQEAIKVSNVPVYQELARRIGLKRYKMWLKKLNYGTHNPGNDVEYFWIKGPLMISAFEQVAFLSRLAQKQLPLSARSQSIVRKIMLYKEQNGATIFAKTGWGAATKPHIGWWVGWVEKKGRIYSFALNMEVQSRQDLPKRISLALEFLKKFGVL